MYFGRLWLCWSFKIFLSIKTFYCHLVALNFISGLTYTESGWHAHTQYILVDHEHGQEETIFGPDPGNSCSPPPHQDGYQPTAMDYHQEVHPLADHIHSHQETNLLKRG